MDTVYIKKKACNSSISFLISSQPVLISFSRQYLQLFMLVLKSWSKKIDHKQSEMHDRSHLHTTTIVRLADATGLDRRFILLGRCRPDQVGRLQQCNGSWLKMAHNITLLLPTMVFEVLLVYFLFFLLNWIVCFFRFLCEIR